VFFWRKGSKRVDVGIVGLSGIVLLLPWFGDFDGSGGGF
jgi:hypothetical protein